MELPHLGTHCSQKDCNKLDFLSIRCDACNQTFCNDHYKYVNHNCPNSYEKDNQVPVCPLCNIPIPISRGQQQQPDVVVGQHIDNDCLLRPSKAFTNRCSMRKCKIKEVVPIVCDECRMNYCLKHRHPTDHQCEGHPRRSNLKKNVKTTTTTSHIQGNMDEDEALARALALSMQDNTTTSTNSVDAKKKQEEWDQALARQLAAETTTTQQQQDRNNRRGERCNIS